MTTPTIDQYAYDLPDVTRQAVEALAASTASPQIFQRGNALVLILPAEPRAKDRLQRTAGAPMIRLCSSPTLRLCLAKAALWYALNQRSKKLVQTMPLPWVVDTVLALGEWPKVPPLTGIILAPTLRTDGTLLDTPGYDEATGLVYDPGPTRFPAIPPAPTKAEALAALDILAEPFQDFPFQAPHHRSAALAAVLTVLVRHAIPGNVPLFGASAPTAGTGKTLLIDTIAAIATGRPAPKLSQPTKEEEWNKQLFTCALEGDQLILIDNCVHPIASGELCKNITAEEVKGRILGVHRNAEAPQNAVYCVTGNNLRFRGDIVRRVIPIELQSALERPETRTGFTIDQPLLEWTHAHRPALVCAALTLLRAYVLASDQPPVPVLGSFEAWSRRICGALVWLGLANPQDGIEDLASEDEDRERLRELLITWYALYQEKPVALRTIKQDIDAHTQDKAAPPNDYHLLFDALKAFDHSRKEGIDLDSVGRNVGKTVGRLVCGKVITREKTRTNKGYPWTVTQKNACNCVGCVGPQPPTRGNANANTGSGVQTPTPPTRQGGKVAQSANSSNGLGGSVGAHGTYTQPTQFLPPEPEPPDAWDAPEETRDTPETRSLEPLEGLRESVLAADVGEGPERASPAPDSPPDGSPPLSTNGRQPSERGSRIGSRGSAGSVPAGACALASAPEAPPRWCAGCGRELWDKEEGESAWIERPSDWECPACHYRLSRQPEAVQP